jgi:hypothetical protein
MALHFIPPSSFVALPLVYSSMANTQAPPVVANQSVATVGFTLHNPAPAVDQVSWAPPSEPLRIFVCLNSFYSWYYLKLSSEHR